MLRAESPNSVHYNINHDLCTDMAMTKGIIVISADYRLLHPSTGFDELEDVQSLFRFLSAEINTFIPPGITVDIAKIAVAGVSAGGHLARLAGLYVNPRPRAVFLLFCMGGDWFSDHYITVKNTPLAFKTEMVSKEAVAHLYDPVPAALAEVPISIDPSTGAWTDPLGRTALMPYWLQTGEYVDHIAGKVGLSEVLRSLPHAERAVAVPANVAKVFPQLHMNAEFPPPQYSFTATRTHWYLWKKASTPTSSCRNSALKANYISFPVETIGSG